ncbi:helix-turn-helix domain-containing protein [Escherichia coli]
MTGYELKLWRRGMNWTQERAAEEFGISLATYKRYEKGEPPRVIEMAIRVLSFDDMVKDLSHLVWEKVKVSSELEQGIK